ncbi:hypothetical protein BHMPCIPO_00085 [Ensifer sesbaniae]|nr:hypothetical protein [Ensifer sesbaniae]
MHQIAAGEHRGGRRPTRRRYPVILRHGQPAEGKHAQPSDHSGDAEVLIVPRFAQA